MVLRQKAVVERRVWWMHEAVNYCPTQVLISKLGSGPIPNAYALLIILKVSTSCWTNIHIQIIYFDNREEVILFLNKPKNIKVQIRVKLSVAKKSL